MTPERLAEIKQAVERYRGKGYPPEIEELALALETERARLDWYLSDFGDIGAFCERHGLPFQTSRRIGTPSEWRVAIDSAREKGVGE